MRIIKLIAPRINIEELRNTVDAVANLQDAGCIALALKVLEELKSKITEGLNEFNG